MCGEGERGTRYEALYKMDRSASIGSKCEVWHNAVRMYIEGTVADPGRGAKEAMPPPPWPVKNSHKKDGHQARRLIFHVSCPPPPPPSEVSGPATE